MVHFLVTSTTHLSDGQLLSRSCLWLVEHKNRSCLWSLQSHAGNGAVLCWENELSPFQVPHESGKRLQVPRASKGAGGGFGTACQVEREKLAGGLPSTEEGIRGHCTWGLLQGAESLACPDLHITEVAGTATALSGGSGGCCALNCTAPPPGFLQDKIRVQPQRCCCYATGRTHKHRHGHWVFQSFPRS